MLTRRSFCDLQFWADSMRNPQVLGARLPQGTYTVMPSWAPAGTGATYHLYLDCLGRQLPFVLDFQGSALVLMVHAIARQPCCKPEACLASCAN